MCEVCSQWARVVQVLVCGKINLTNHHPDCPHYNDSLMDVWVARMGKSSAYNQTEEDARMCCAPEDLASGEAVITQEKMPEFDGF